MKKLLSLLLILLLCVSAMPSVVLAADTTTDDYIFTRDATPSTAILSNRSSGKQTLTVGSDANGDEYYLYALSDETSAYLEYLDSTMSMVYEMTFMLTSSTSSVKFEPVYYDPNKQTPGFNWTSILTVSQNGVVVQNIDDATGEDLFTKSESGWNGDKFTLIPNVTLDEKHTIRLEHNPETAKFTIWFDSNKAVLNENPNGAWVEATVTSSNITGDNSNGKINGMRFAHAGITGDAIRVYRFYIRGTKEGNTNANLVSKVFDEALSYTYANDDVSNSFSYYIDTNNNAVITGFKYRTAPTDSYDISNPLVFPTTLENHPVTAIADYAFTIDSSGWPVNPSNSTGNGYTVWENIKAIKLPDTLKTIGDNSMRGFKNITAVEIPDSVESVGASAFANLTAAEKLDLGTSLKTIGNYAFSYLGKNNFDLVVPKSVEAIGSQAFTYSRIQTIVFEGAPEIGTYMFRNNNWLQKVVFLKDMTLNTGFFGNTDNQNTNKNICIVGSKAMYDTACANANSAGVKDCAYTHSDIYVYKTAATPSVYYWGTDDDATLIKAQYNKTTKELASCVPVTMTAGQNYALELGDGTYDVKNMFWSMNDCKPLIAPVEY